MPPSLLHPPSHLSPEGARQQATLAPSILKNFPESISSTPILSLFSAPETAELWVTYENLLLACLRTGDDLSAHKCLERLIKRFGDKNERMMAFKGLVKEATAKNNTELEAILKEYDNILAEEENNIVSRQTDTFQSYVYLQGVEHVLTDCGGNLHVAHCKTEDSVAPIIRQDSGCCIWPSGTCRHIADRCRGLG